MKKLKCDSLNTFGWDLCLHRFEELEPRNLLNLFHYTNKFAKTKIVNDRGIDFRLSRVKDFIDKNEGVQIIEPFYHACGRLHEHGEIDDEFFEIVRSIAVKDIGNKDEDLWILCLSQNGFSSYMKERYASKDGWIIGVQAYALEDLKVNLDNALGYISIVAVQYSNAKMRRIFESDLKRLYQWYCYDKKNNTFGSQKALQQKLKNMISSRLSFYRYCYKNADYKQEEEIRVLVNIKPGFTEWSSEENDIVLKREKNNNKSELHLLFGKEYIYSISQKLSWVESTKLNKQFITGEEIREAMISINKRKENYE